MSRKIFNLRISRARRIVEVRFGTLVKKWRVFDAALGFDYETVKIIINATVLLHNFLITNELQFPEADQRYTNDEIVEDDVAEFDAGEFDAEEFDAEEFDSEELDAEESDESLQEEISTKAEELRRILNLYFLSDGLLPWQNNKALQIKQVLI